MMNSLTTSQFLGFQCNNIGDLNDDAFGVITSYFSDIDNLAMKWTCKSMFKRIRGPQKSHNVVAAAAYTGHYELYDQLLKQGWNAKPYIDAPYCIVARDRILVAKNAADFFVFSAPFEYIQMLISRGEISFCGVEFAIIMRRVDVLVALLDSFREYPHVGIKDPLALVNLAIKSGDVIVVGALTMHLTFIAMKNSVPTLHDPVFLAASNSLSAVLASNNVGMLTWILKYVHVYAPDCLGSLSPEMLNAILNHSPAQLIPVVRRAMEINRNDILLWIANTYFGGVLPFIMFMQSVGIDNIADYVR